MAIPLSRPPTMRSLLSGAISLAVLALAACSETTEPGTGIGGTRRLTAGESTACALDRDGATSCWGANSNFFEYGASPGTVPPTALPVLVPVPRLATLSVGNAQHMCGITSAREAICWGRGTNGQLGRGEVEPAGNTPAAVNLAAQWDGIAVGRLTTCGWTVAGKGYCWGLNQRGEIGDTSVLRAAKVLLPREVNGGITFTSIVPGWLHTCGIASSGAAYCWGANSSGQLGIGAADTVDHAHPVLVSPTFRFKKLSLGARSTCGITTANQLLCWGANTTGQLGDGTTTQRDTPTPVASSVKFTDVALGSGFAGGVNSSVILPSGTGQGGIAHTCAISEAQTAYCWGWNGAGQVGDATSETRLSPVSVAGGIKFTSLALGGAYTCGIGATALWCWGSSAFGQLGNANFADSSVPVRVIYSWP